MNIIFQQHSTTTTITTIIRLDVIQRALTTANAFHAAPAEVKAVHAARRLYDAPGNVKIAVRPATLHERFSYPRVVTKDAGIAGPEAVKSAAKLDGADRAPPTAIDEDPPPLFDVPGVDVDGAMRAFQKHILRLALALTRAMAIKLGLEVCAWDHAWAATNSGCTSLHYLPVSTDTANTRSDGYSGEQGKLDDDGIGDLGAELRAYPHADGDSMLTVCLRIAPGLYVYCICVCVCVCLFLTRHSAARETNLTSVPPVPMIALFSSPDAYCREICV